MCVSGVCSTPTQAPTVGLEKAKELGPDHDGDTDDNGVQSPPVQAAPALGTGLLSTSRLK
jgi:hypothetical protein